MAVLIPLVFVDSRAIADYHFNPRYAKAPNWRAWAGYIEQREKEDDFIIETYPDPAFWYYYKGNVAHRLLPPQKPADVEALDEELTHIVQSYRRVWLLHGGRNAWNEEGRVETWLGRHAYRLSTEGAPTQNLALFLSPAILVSSPLPVVAEFGGKVELIGRIIGELDEGGLAGGEGVRPGESLQVTLVWRAAQGMAESYTVFAHLLDSYGKMWAQHDGLPAKGYPTSAWRPGEVVVSRHEIMTKSDMPSGEYAVEVGLYELATMHRLPVLSPEGTVAGDSLLIGKVKIGGSEGEGLGSNS